MSLISEIRADYTDGNGLVSPKPCSPMLRSASDNGVMYTSELIIMLVYDNQKIPALPSIALSSCISDGLLYRHPVAQGGQQEGPDDYYGLIAALKVSKSPYTAARILGGVIKYRGFLNNVNPGVKTWDSFLIRQPQLLCAMITAAFPSMVNPMHYLVRLFFFPLYVYTALIIATSCLFAPKTDTDARRLSWLLVQTVKNTSILCKLASLIWYRRLYKHFPGGMKDVAAIYYQPPGQHPFAKYWID